jgi:hypothetical protein
MKGLRPRRLFAFACMASALQCAFAHDSTPVMCAGGIAIPMERERSGHISAKLEINDIPVRVLIDTGTNVNTIDVDAVTKLKADIESTTADPFVLGYATLRLSVDGSTLGEQPFTAMKLGFINIRPTRDGTEQFAGMLGAEFFAELGAKINFPQMVICVFQPKLRPSISEKQ